MRTPSLQTGPWRRAEGSGQEHFELCAAGGGLFRGTLLAGQVGAAAGDAFRVAARAVIDQHWPSVTTVLSRRSLTSLGLAASVLACGGEEQGPRSTPVELVVYAATSTRAALQALEVPYEQEHGVELVFNFGSSGDLSRQIIAAAKADVFLSADEPELDRVEQAGLVAAGSRRALLSNQLVVIEPAGGPSVFTAPFEPAQLADPRIQRLSLAHVESVPAGRYARAWLEMTGTWAAVSARVLPGVDVRAALAAVEFAGAQAGIVYRTDVAGSHKARVVFAVPREQGPSISYPVAALGARPGTEEARAFVDFLASPSAGAVFVELGFVFLPATSGRQE